MPFYLLLGLQVAGCAPRPVEVEDFLAMRKPVSRVCMVEAPSPVDSRFLRMRRYEWDLPEWSEPYYLTEVVLLDPSTDSSRMVLSARNLPESWYGRIPAASPLRSEWTGGFTIARAGWSPDGGAAWFWAGGPEWNLPGTVVASLAHGTIVVASDHYPIAWSPDGSQLALIPADPTIGDAFMLVDAHLGSTRRVHVDMEEIHRIVWPTSDEIRIRGENTGKPTELSFVPSTGRVSMLRPEHELSEFPLLEPDITWERWVGPIGSEVRRECGRFSTR